MSDLRLIVGLGNPGKDYEWTRHNLGFLVMRELARWQELKFKPSHAGKGYVALGKVDQQEYALFLPHTFMNNSGVAVRAFVDKHEVPLSHTLVVCDDFNVDFGELRLRKDGSSGGHNGLKSLIEHLHSDNFPRLRLGIGRPPVKMPVADFVLQDFSKSEKEQLSSFVQEAAECCLLWLTQQFDKVMSQFNKRKGNG